MLWEPIEHDQLVQETVLTLFRPGSSKGRKNAQQQGEHGSRPHGCWWWSSSRVQARSRTLQAEGKYRGLCAGSAANHWRCCNAIGATGPKRAVRMACGRSCGVDRYFPL